LSVLTGFTGGDRAAYETIVTRFNETHPTIQVTMDIQPWDSIGQTLPSAWGTGSGPDIATPNFDPGIVYRYVDDDLVLPLDNLLGTDETQLDPAVVPEFVLDAFTVDETLYAAPANVATLQLYYNTDLFEAAGLAGPPTTSDELVDAVTQLTAGETYGISLADHETIQMWPLLIWMNGGDVMSSATCSALDSPETIEALTTWAGLVADEGVSPVGLTGAESDSLFAAAQAAMQMNGPWAAPGYADAGVNFAVAPIPAGAEGQVTLASTVPMMISAGTEHPAEAQEFLAWWNSAEAQRQFALDSGFPPTRTDLADDPEIMANEVVAQFASALPDARLYLPGVRVASQIDTDVFVPLIESITRGADVTEAATAAAQSANELAGCEG
jgi:multiple sugar transport system substrate-binding protein